MSAGGINARRSKVVGGSHKAIRGQLGGTGTALAENEKEITSNAS